VSLNGLSPLAANANGGFKLMKRVRVFASLSMPRAVPTGVASGVLLKKRVEMHNSCG
jgi:hypothetical protein